MKSRRLAIKLESGDVRSLRVFSGKRTFRLAIYDEDSAVPLIDAKLTPAEWSLLRKSNGNRK